MATGQTSPINSGQRMALFSRYNRRLSSRLLSRDGCAGPSCIALRRYTVPYAYRLPQGQEEEEEEEEEEEKEEDDPCARQPGKSPKNAKISWSEQERARADARREKERIIYYAVSMSLTMTASSILVTRRLSSRPISADHR